MSDLRIKAQRLLDPVMLRPQPGASRIDQLMHLKNRLWRFFRLKALSVPRLRPRVQSDIDRYRAISRREFQLEVE